MYIGSYAPSAAISVKNWLELVSIGSGNRAFDYMLKRVLMRYVPQPLIEAIRSGGMIAIFACYGNDKTVHFSNLFVFDVGWIAQRSIWTDGM
jgi:hypothetical protein